MPDPLPLLVEAAREGGLIALDHWRQNPETWQKDDDSPVSAADLAVDTHLREHLMGAHPDHGWLSEETADTPDRLKAERCFILDPIDGTRAFLAGETSWAVSLAVTEGPEVVAAVVHLPARDMTYTAAHGRGARLNGLRISTSDRHEADGARMLANKATYAPGYWRRLPAFQRMFRPSLAYRIACVAEGKADAMLTLRRAWEWDIAAGALIASEAGAQVTDRHGARLRFNTPEAASDGVLIAGPTLHRGILDVLV
ncbi:3'(2'),5'-bisphosphate nucleotidase CysQ [Palleronia caenipelagi]|uniref:3'(2'),5'-bisphosphate nucleotidase CysQ n=1 Tax=Palleronia caenipelagi TaxID=2489174 RepID=UPI00319E388A